MTEKIGVLGGAFDPIHIGHLILAQSALDELKLSRVLFVPSFAPAVAHKVIPTGFAHRLEMTRLAIAGNDRFRASAIEEVLKPPSYTVTLMERLHKEIPDAEFYFLMGADSLEQVGTWHDPERLIKLAKLVAAPRSGSNLQSTFPFARLDMPLIEISATQLRQRVRDGFSLRYLVPESVIAYIDANRLYRED
ncbi:MAG: nicotinate (nicotinamide) nucleotide adenylyltransferase [candidate division Zixibacteria bacterium]|nr:nicotinate (nicotinamide) nucleotide adenylyltransferase [candidate division Zixibacteria bacterium]